MRDGFAREFYSSNAWRECREKYRKSVGNLCENCLRSGLIEPGIEVHHVKKLTPENIGNPRVTLCWDNLELLCDRCHKLAHKRKRRFEIDGHGHLTIQDTPLG